MAWATPGLHLTDPPPEAHEGRRPPPAPRPLQCPAPSASTTSDGGLLRAASPRSTTKDSVSVLYHVATVVWRTDSRSSGIIHYTHPRPGRWLLPSVTTAANRLRLEQEGPYYYDICPEHWQSQAPQGARERQWHFLHWKIMAHGRSVGCRELCALDT